MSGLRRQKLQQNQPVAMGGRRRRGRRAGVALLMVVSIIAVLSVVLVEFSSTARTHLSTGINVRDDVRATTIADTALVMTRACLDQTAWGPMAGAMKNVDMEKVCNLILGIFVEGRVDLPIGGLSLELQGIKGVGLDIGEVEELSLVSEQSFIGLAGLYCPTNTLSCSPRISLARTLRTLFCDPRVAHVFEKEQEDGHRYTREEVVGNLIDWVDSDDNRIYIDPLTWQFQAGAGEGEDSYLREGSLKYRSKDAPFDSIEELRMVRGINDELYNFLKDKVSVHAGVGVDINTASVEVIATLLRAASPAARNLEAGTCGEDPGTANFKVDRIFMAYAALIVRARSGKGTNSPLNKPYKNPNQFITDAKDPLAAIVAAQAAFFPTTSDEVLINLLGPQDGPVFGQTLYPLFQSGQLVVWDDFKRSIRTQNNLYRLRVRGQVGNMSRQMFAILRMEGGTVRTLYYREE